MTKEEFVEEFRHEIGGMVLDAATAQRTGAELALSIRTVMRRIDAKLGQMYDALAPAPEQPKPGPQTNGKPAAATPATTARK